jgi:hypothetical protein
LGGSDAVREGHFRFSSTEASLDEFVDHLRVCV